MNGDQDFVDNFARRWFSNTRGTQRVFAVAACIVALVTIAYFLTHPGQGYSGASALWPSVLIVQVLAILRAVLSEKQVEVKVEDVKVTVETVKAKVEEVKAKAEDVKAKVEVIAKGVNGGPAESIRAAIREEMHEMCGDMKSVKMAMQEFDRRFGGIEGRFDSLAAEFHKVDLRVTALELTRNIENAKPLVQT